MWVRMQVLPVPASHHTKPQVAITKHLPDREWNHRLHLASGNLWNRQHANSTTTAQYEFVISDRYVFLRVAFIFLLLKSSHSCQSLSIMAMNWCDKCSPFWNYYTSQVLRIGHCFCRKHEKDRDVKVSFV